MILSKSGMYILIESDGIIDGNKQTVVLNEAQASYLRNFLEGLFKAKYEVTKI